MNSDFAHRITIIDTALGLSKQANCTLSTPDDDQGDGTMSCDQPFELIVGHSIRQQGMHVQPLDDALHGVAKIGFVKMDIEGFEHYALAGGHHTFFRRKIPYVMMEYQPHLLGPNTYPDPPQSLLERFIDAGYSLTIAGAGTKVAMTAEEIHSMTKGSGAVDIWMTHRSLSDKALN